MQNALPSPAHGVPAQVLPHLHLVSKYRYPSVNSLSIEAVVNYLLEAPKIVRDLQPMSWTFLDAPADGTILLIWQPLEFLGTNFANDGYVWADAEHAFNHDAKGYTLEMYMHRSGFHPPNESISAHARKRYRLMHGRNQPPGQAQCDSALWLVHYVKAERRDHIPANQISVPPQVQHSLRERAFLQRQGQLPRKDFMLHDQKNWPTINIPGLPNANPAAAAQGGFGRGGPLGPAPPGGRARGRGPSISMVEATVEEEEDVSRGDMLDFLTPREISRMRYEQHHEWMEEVLNSPYHINQIVPVELGLGRKGALEDFTNGFFTAPTTVAYEPTPDGYPPRVGKMEGDKAAAFRQHAEVKLAKMQAELEKMAKEHATRMAQLQRSSLYTSMERKLRYAVDDTNPSTTDSLRLERGRAGQDVPSGPRPKVTDLVFEVESATNKLAISVKDVECVERGGLEEKPEDAEPEEALTSSPEPASSADVSMGDTAAEQLPQPRQQSPAIRGTESPSKSPLPNLPSAMPPVPETTAQSTAPPSVSTPTHVDNDDVNQTGGADLAGVTGMDGDIDMSGLDSENPETADDAHVDDWVLVNEDTPAEAEQSQDAATAEAASAPDKPQQQQPPSAAATPAQAPPATASPAVNLTQTSTSTHATPVAEETEHTPLDTNDFSAFENINTAGEAMEGFETGVDPETDLHDTHDLGVGDTDEIDFGDLGDHDMVGGDMDDLAGPEESAFGEAFHGTDLGGDD